MNDGNQHDAQEFLASLLNGLNEEYVKVLKMYDEWSESSHRGSEGGLSDMTDSTGALDANNNPVRVSDSNASNQNETHVESPKWGTKSTKSSLANMIKSSTDNPDQWETVTTKTSKKIQARYEPQETSKTNTEASPISRMFNGMTYTSFEEVKPGSQVVGKGNQQGGLGQNILGQKPPQILKTLRGISEPFLMMTLHMATQLERVQKQNGHNGTHGNIMKQTTPPTILETLKAQSAPEQIEDYKLNQIKIKHVQKKDTIENLPPILILHLNFCTYNPNTGESIKTQSDVDVPQILEFPDEILKNSSGSTIKPKYSLFAIIYHHGQRVRSGHYTSEVKVCNSWWTNCDDEKISLAQNRQKKTYGTKMPYLLLYMNENDRK